MVSGRLTPAAATLTRTSPCFGCGTGRVPILSTSGPPGWVISTARIVFGIVMSRPRKEARLSHFASHSTGTAQASARGQQAYPVDDFKTKIGELGSSLQAKLNLCLRGINSSKNLFQNCPWVQVHVFQNCP